MREPDTRSAIAIPGIEDLEPLGRGGFGTVYRGWQPALRRHIAVKVLDAPASDPESAGRFEREAMAMGALSGHPNVVPVHDIGTVGDRLYLVMALLPDGSLQDRMAEGPLPPHEVVALGRGLADALDAAHRSGVLHRDVKPANVLRTSYGAYQLTDFGIARLSDVAHTVGGPLTATVTYTAPEVLAGQPATEKADVYALGATLHAAARGRPPYEPRGDEAPVAMAVRILSERPPDLRADGVPPALAAVIDRAMARDPEERYPTAAALRDALDALDLHADPDATAVAAPIAAGAPTTVLPADRTAVAPVVHEGRYRPAAAPPRSSGAGWLLALLALAILGVVAFLLLRDDGDGADGTAPSTVPPATTVAPEAPAEGDPEAPEATEAPPATEEPPATEAPAAQSPDVESAVRDYYALMDAGRIDEGFERLSPAYQEETGEDSYREFWSSIDGVDVLDVQADGLEATATLEYLRDDGTTSTEQAVIRFVEDPDSGALLIDGYEVVG